MRKLLDYILLYLKGIGMGAVEIIPGISGGTVALMTGIYSELITSINAISLQTLKLLPKGQLQQFWKVINGNFLLVLLLGFLTTLILFAKVASYGIRNYPIHIWSFFFGLILISAPLILRQVKKWSISTAFALLVGIFTAYAITLIPPSSTPHTLLWVFVCGLIAISSLILPGVSGAFILVLFGKYDFLIRAFGEPHLTIVFVFLCGSVLGLLGFSRILGYIIENYYSTAVALIAGFMIGVLNKVWPWREVLEYVPTLKGQLPAYDKSILPSEYFNVTGKDPLVFQAILMAALGVFIVVLIEKIAARYKIRF